MPRTDLVVGESLDSVVRWAADRVLHLYRQATRHDGSFNVALAGGTTPRSLYELLSSPLFRTRFDWKRVGVFLGDERYVPMGDPRSNYRMISETLLDKVLIPGANVHPVPTRRSDIRRDAEAYAGTLSESLPVDATGTPVFDLALVGLGPDGYAAGLFPGSPTIRETNRSAVGVRPPLSPAPWITLTPRVFNAARHVIFLAAGALKAGALSLTLARAGSAQEIPARVIDPSPGTLTIAADAAACARLGDVHLRPGVMTRHI